MTRSANLERSTFLCTRPQGAVNYHTVAYPDDFMPYVGIPAFFDKSYEPTPKPDGMVAGWAVDKVLPWIAKDVPWPKGNSSDWRSVDARGWPLVAFYCEYSLGPSWTHDAHGALHIPGGRKRLNGRFLARPADVALPFLPIWPNLALDTALYSTAWYLLLLAPRTIRSTYRRRHARCISCGYDLSVTPASLPCPECGRTR